MLSGTVQAYVCCAHVRTHVLGESLDQTYTPCKPGLVYTARGAHQSIGTTDLLSVYTNRSNVPAAGKDSPRVVQCRKQAMHTASAGASLLVRTSTEHVLWHLLLFGPGQGLLGMPACRRCLCHCARGSLTVLRCNSAWQRSSRLHQAALTGVFQQWQERYACGDLQAVVTPDVTGAPVHGF
jgi:hypothetical protein